LSKSKREKDIIKKRQLLVLLIGIVGAAIIGIGTNVISVLAGLVQIGNFGPLAGLFLAFAVFYAISEHQLLNIRLIISESLVYFIVLILTVQLFFSTSKVDLLFKTLFIIITIIIGRSSLQAIREETKQKEKLDKLSHQLEKANADLKALDKVKDDFLSMASHELNTPIAAIEGYLSMILVEKIAGHIPEKAKRYLESVYTSSQRLAHLVKDLLNVSRIESDRIHLIYEEAEITDIIEQSIMEIDPKIKEGGHVLKYNKPKHKIPTTWLDKTRITEVMINMLGNSCKYTNPGGKIEIDVMNDDQKIVVSVKDNGKGIPKDRNQAVFEKFSQVDVLKDEVKGTGLGMYISKRFIELMKGKMWFFSEGENKGTTFYFSIPILAKKPYDPHDGEDAVLH
jgi:signal transduction histidine kinase